MRSIEEIEERIQRCHEVLLNAGKHVDEPTYAKVVAELNALRWVIS